ncbi:MAG: hypothetical protein KAS19_03545, partial [Anaerolineales bacterium]|nr:hypothetical protein [Anaerolineales bacterium]
DGACASNQCSSLDTPVVVVPENALVFVAMVMLIPLVVGGSRRRTAIRAWFRQFRETVKGSKSKHEASVRSRWRSIVEKLMRRSKQ